MRVATYNILNGGCGREDTLARVVETIQPDVLGLQEVVSPEFVLSLAERLGFSSVMSQVSGRTNVALLSRFPILRSASYQPLPFSKPVLEVELQVPPDQTLTVFVLHLRVDPELPFERRRLREILAALEIARSRRDRPILLMGDLNALEPGAPIRVEPMLKLAQSVAARRHTRTSAWSGIPRSAYDRVARILLALPRGPVQWLMSRIVRRRVIQAVLAEGYVDLFRRLNAPSTPGYTSPADDPGLRIDYVFATPDLAERCSRCEVFISGLTRRASDHCPVVCEFSIEGDGS